MHSLLRKKLEKINKDLEKERDYLRKVFMPNRSQADIMARKKLQILEEWAEEKRLLKKYKMNTMLLPLYVLKTF